MGRYVIRRLLTTVVVVWGVATVVFLMLQVAADPVSSLLPEGATAADREMLREQLGLTRPVYVRYADFLWKSAQGDFGISYFVKGQQAMPLVLDRLPATATLAFSGLAVAIVMGIGLGVVSAFKRYSIVDNLATVLAIMGQAMPNFWLGIMLILLFSVTLKILPVSGREGPLSLVLPALTLGAYLAPILMRLTRSGMVDVLTEDYIRTARSKGLAERNVLIRHALHNAAIPVVTVIGYQFGRLMGGSLVVETVFAWPGVARLMVDSITTSDLPIVEASVIVIATMIVLANLAADVAVGLLDPRIRYD